MMDFRHSLLPKSFETGRELQGKAFIHQVHCSSGEPSAAAWTGHLDFPRDFFHSHFLRRKWKCRKKEMAFPGPLMDVGVFMDRH